MTPERLADIKARAEAATPGPWGAVDFALSTYCGFNNDSLAEPSTFEDAVFIAYSRQDIPDLIAEVERLRGKLMLDSAGAFEAEAWVKDSDGWCVRAREGEDFTAHGWRRVRVREVAP